MTPSIVFENKDQTQNPQQKWEVDKTINELKSLIIRCLPLRLKYEKLLCSNLSSNPLKSMGA